MWNFARTQASDKAGNSTHPVDERSLDQILNSKLFEPLAPPTARRDCVVGIDEVRSTQRAVEPSASLEANEAA